MSNVHHHKKNRVDDLSAYEQWLLDKDEAAALRLVRAVLTDRGLPEAFDALDLLTSKAHLPENTADLIRRLRRHVRNHELWALDQALFLEAADALVTLQAAHDEWKLEADRRGLPKELMQRLHRAEADVQQIRQALLGLRCTESMARTPWECADGQPCWCGTGENHHSEECLAARAALAKGGDKDDSQRKS